MLFNREYWKGMIEWLEDKVVKEGCVTKDELKIFTVVDTPKEAIAVVKKFYASR